MGSRSPATERVLRALVQSSQSEGMPPSIRRIGELAGLSPRGVMLQLQALEREGLAARSAAISGVQHWHATRDGFAAVVHTPGTCPAPEHANCTESGEWLPCTAPQA